MGKNKNKNKNKPAEATAATPDEAEEPTTVDTPMGDDEV